MERPRLRTVAVVTVSRSDYGLYRPILRLVESDPGLALELIVAGTHLLPEFGLTVDDIELDGFIVAERVETAPDSDSPKAVAGSIGKGVVGFSRVFSKRRPDILLVLGDRYEMLAAVVAALPFNIPIAHVHGGESTQGAIDEAIRHSITKISHLHFAATEDYARRIVQLGEEPWRVTVSGAPGLDNLNGFRPDSPAELETEYGLDLATPPLLVTYHPVTLEYEQTSDQMAELLAALDRSGLPVVFTYPGADTGFSDVIRLTEDFVRRHSNARTVVNMGTDAYFRLMGQASAMVGNSSSGIIEAASFELPVVNVGNRQAGRIRPENVIDVECEEQAILEGIRLATSSEFRDRMAGLANPYGDGRAAPRIVAALKDAELDSRMLVKRFYDLPVDAAVGAGMK